MKIKFAPIGAIYTPFTDPKGMPIQPAGAADVVGRVAVLPKYEEGLADLENFSHLILIYYFHQSRDYQLTVTPFLDRKPHGLFATRAPRRPNPIGLSIVRLIERQKTDLIVSGVDVLNETPLLDIKPYVPFFDAHPQAKAGWLEGKVKKSTTQKSDDRFLS
jgi:tRNA-Thr(GGU) m(6)t(6)A37 methyltransferase TsaA